MNGVLVIMAHNITLDCKNSVINGTGFDFKEYPRYRFGIYNGGYSNVEIKNCIVMNFMDGILFINSKGSKIHNNTLINNNNGIVIDNTYPYYEEKIEYRNFEHVPTSGKNLVFENKLMENGNGINLLGSKENLIFGNELEKNNIGIILQISLDNKIVGNVIKNSKSEDILLIEKSYNNSIIGNVLLSSKSIIMKDGSAVIIGNVLKDFDTIVPRIPYGNFYLESGEFNFMKSPQEFNLIQVLREEFLTLIGIALSIIGIILAITS
ncbi:MAG: NosD domain-containing protein [Candidatus Aenigmatarchaeota archaeon]